MNDADYADLKRRLAKDVVTVRALHVTGDLDAATLLARQGLKLRLGASATTLWVCTGLPVARMGQNGDYAFRYDGASSAHLYFKSTGTWGAIA